VPVAHALLVGRRLVIRASDVALALGVFVAVAGPWYVAAGVIDPAYLREFFLVHHLERFTSEGTTFHAGAWWYYGPALLLMMFPWSFLLPGALGAATPRRAPAVGYALCWAVIVVGFFSLSHGKLATYILPALPPLAVVVAHGLGRLEAARAPHVLATRIAGGGVVALAVTLAVIAGVALHLHHPPWDGVVHAHAVAILLLPVGGVIGVAAWWRRGIRAACSVIAATTAGALLYFYVAAAPAVSRVTSEGAFAHAIAAHPEAPITSFQVTPASLMFYVRRPILRLNRPRDLRDAAASAPFVWIVTSQRHVPEIAAVVPAFPWVTGGRHVLYATAPPPGPGAPRPPGSGRP
jgi:4-amino-4-deoxy-L-arabinose transferase-like glycosyltransferase